MNVELINGWWLTTDSGGQMGTTDTSGIGQKQIENASKIYMYLEDLDGNIKYSAYLSCRPYLIF